MSFPFHPVYTGSDQRLGIGAGEGDLRAFLAGMPQPPTPSPTAGAPVPVAVSALPRRPGETDAGYAARGGSELQFPAGTNLDDVRRMLAMADAQAPTRVMPAAPEGRPIAEDAVRAFARAAGIENPSPELLQRIAQQMGLTLAAPSAVDVGAAEVRGTSPKGSPRLAK